MKQMKSSEFKSFIYGTLLGDSCIHKNGKTFRCRQINKDIILYKKKVIEKHLPGAKITLKETPAYSDGKWNHKTCYTLEVKHKYFRKLYDVFYKDGRKIINQKILNALKPNGYAIWYADDGTTSLLGGLNEATGSAKNRRIELCTDNFTKEEVELIKKHFDRQFKCNCKLIPRKYKGYDNEHYRLRIPNLEGQNFLEIISPYFTNYPSYLYKLDMGYRNDSLNNKRYVTESYKELFLNIKTHNDFIDRLK